ncbi:MAG TPA: hypothetical protein VGU64_15915 [Terriglobales bacterium]|nr:hypothetical protein [Terriglobales bacterium]
MHILDYSLIGFLQSRFGRKPWLCMEHDDKAKREAAFSLRQRACAVTVGLTRRLAILAGSPQYAEPHLGVNNFASPARAHKQQSRPGNSGGLLLTPVQTGVIRLDLRNSLHVIIEPVRYRDAQPDKEMIAAAGPRSSGAGQLSAKCGFLNSIIGMGLFPRNLLLERRHVNLHSGGCRNGGLTCLRLF